MPAAARPDRPTVPEPPVPEPLEPPYFEQLSIEGAWSFTPKVLHDPRGAFFEWVRGAQFEHVVGQPLRVAQGNFSVSRAGVVRGIHLATTPPGQAKYVTCVGGRCADVIVDLRIGSPTFGRHEFVELSADNHRAVYVSEGLGHGFVAQADDSTLTYLVSEPYNATGEFGVHPFDPDLGIDWPVDTELTLSDRDAAAPTLREVTAAGRLPDYDTCRRFRQGLAGAGSRPQ